MSLSYEIAVKMKEAGFPQNSDYVFLKGDENYFPMLECAYSEIYSGRAISTEVYSPTLSELIEGCGDITIVIWGCKKQ